MNVYDFDNTIYMGDSSVDFWLYCLKKKPIIIVLLPYQVWMAILYKIKLIDKVRFKEAFFCFLRLLPDTENTVEHFWNRNGNKIKKWYKKKQKEDDIVISASPYFLLIEICGRIGVSNLIATDVDMVTGKFRGPNCYGDEKVNRFLKLYGSETVDEFYSDSYSDYPMRKMALRGYLVRGERIVEWII